MATYFGGGQAGGQIVTFYSYEGRAGRTTATANIAWILATNGYRILAVDWDFSSPNLHHFFRPFLDEGQLRTTRGLRGALWDHVHPTSPSDPDMPDPVSPYACRIQGYDFPANGLIDLVTTIGPHADRVQIMDDDDLEDLYRRPDALALLGTFAQDMARGYDFVLIDSQDGTTDSASYCTVGLPDVLVICFRHHRSSIEAAKAITDSVREQRARNPIRILPVPMLVEDAEQLRLEYSRDYMTELFADVLDLDTEQLIRYIGDVEIPYKPYYSYEAILAAFADRPNQEGTLLKAFERLATVLLGTPCRLQPADKQISRRWLAELERPNWNETPLVAQAARVQRTDRATATVQISQDSPKPRIFISYVREDSATIDKLVAGLEANGIEVWLDRTSLAVGDRWKDTIRQAIRHGDYFVACFSAAYSRRNSTYMNEELLVAIEELRLRPRTRRWFLPVVIHDGTVPATPISATETIQDIHHIDLSQRWDDGIADLVRVVTSDG